ncbi:MAG: glutamate synthase [Oscillospiraceae bacterium]|jgi:glutamate synthase domain-containing protein 3|nr:glutamate synthase [Oscillospiraceae bacterium]
MATIDAKGLHFSALGEQLRDLAGHKVRIYNCLGQRYIAAGIKDITLDIDGIPGNALGAYLGEGSSITVRGNAQDATGDTMNGGSIIIHGSAGDAAGYAMRGGTILIRDDVGYRCGIHMKEFGDKIPKLCVGGRAGDFLGEYQAGGVICVLGLDCGENESPVGRFAGTGQHGGRIFIRTKLLPAELPPQVSYRTATAEDKAILCPLLKAYADAFGANYETLVQDTYLLLTPNSANPYESMYVQY